MEPDATVQQTGAQKEGTTDNKEPSANTVEWDKEPAAPRQVAGESQAQFWHRQFAHIRNKGRLQIQVCITWNCTVKVPTHCFWRKKRWGPLQKLLWHRLQGRCKARTQVPMSAGFYNSIVSELDYTLGSRPSRAVMGAPPPNPYERAALFMDHLDATDASPARKVPATLQLEDVHIIEQFYNQLCLLVQAQKASDPASLLCIHNVCPFKP